MGTRLPSLSCPGPWEPLASLPPSGHQSPEGFLQHLGVPGGTHSWGDRGGFREPENTLDTTQHFTGAHLLVETNEGLDSLANGALCFSDVVPAQVWEARPVWRKALSEEGAAGEVVSRFISPAHHGLHRWSWPSGGGWVGVLPQPFLLVSVRGPQGGKSLLTMDCLLPMVITNPTWSTRAARLGTGWPDLAAGLWWVGGCSPCSRLKLFSRRAQPAASAPPGSLVETQTLRPLGL